MADQNNQESEWFNGYTWGQKDGHTWGWWIGCFCGIVFTFMAMAFWDAGYKLYQLLTHK